MPSLCRDCHTMGDVAFAKCGCCGSGRVIEHEALATLSIAHIDCDAFFAAIEKRDNPELRHKPVIVGGGKRGVVATCCYLARIHGVRSAMPMFKALKLCPQAVVVRGRKGVYSEASRAIQDKLRQLTPLVQMLSIDEGYLDLTGTERIHNAPPAAVLSKLAQDVESDIGITISIGLSENKFLAKTASELDKPRGFAALSFAEAAEFLASKPVGFLHGVGKQLATKLERDGYTRIASLQSENVRNLMQKYGDTGLWLHNRSLGIDNRPVRVESDRKSVSAERTFETDIDQLSLLEDRLWQVCEEASLRAKRHGAQGSTITLKLKRKDFRTITRSITLRTPTNLAQSLFRETRQLLIKETGRGQAYRLIGVGLSHLSNEAWNVKDLVDPSIEKRANAERASDQARSKFGDIAVVTGRTIKMQQDKVKTDKT